MQGLARLRQSVRQQTLLRLFMWPGVMSMLTLIGLLVALIEDDNRRELLGVVALTIPVVVIIYAVMIKK